MRQLREKLTQPNLGAFEILKVQKPCAEITDLIPGGIRLQAESVGCQKSKAVEMGVHMAQPSHPW